MCASIQVELLIPQLQFLDEEGAQAELWELSRVFLDTLIEETGCQVHFLMLCVKVIHLLVYSHRISRVKNLCIA